MDLNKYFCMWKTLLTFQCIISFSIIFQLFILPSLHKLTLGKHLLFSLPTVMKPNIHNFLSLPLNLKYIWIKFKEKILHSFFVNLVFSFFFSSKLSWCQFLFLFLWNHIIIMKMTLFEKNELSFSSSFPLLVHLLNKFVIFCEISCSFSFLFTCKRIYFLVKVG